MLTTKAEYEEGRAAARKTALALPLKMLAGLILGTVIGINWPSLAVKLEPLGLIFIEAIKMVVMPLVFSAVTLGVYRMGNDMKRLGRVAGTTIFWFLIATTISITIALLLHEIFHPGIGTGLQPSGKLPDNFTKSVDWVKYIIAFIPTNIVAAMAEQKVLPVLVFAVLFGLALAATGRKADPIVGFMDAVLAAVFKMTNWIISLSPLAVFAMMSWIFATQGVGCCCR